MTARGDYAHGQVLSVSLAASQYSHLKSTPGIYLDTIVMLHVCQ